MRRIALVFVFLFVCATAQSRTFQAEVTHVTDGDTVWVRAGHGAPRQVRLRGIDAPESCQPHGAEARQALAARVLHRPVAVTLAGKDDYQRWLGTLHSNGEDVSAWLVSSGHAWAHSWRRRAGPYAGLEANARRAGRGLWAQRAPIEPRQFRKLHGKCSAS